MRRAICSDMSRTITNRCFPIGKGEATMPRGDKSKYTGKQKRQAEHIEEGYKSRGLGEDEAERRAWATVNKSSGGGKQPGGSGRGKATNKEPSKKGGRLGGRASAHPFRRSAVGLRKKSGAHSQAQRFQAEVARRLIQTEVRAGRTIRRTILGK